MMALDQALASLQSEAGDDRTLFALARGMLRGYDARWGQAHQQIKLAQVEEIYTSPLFNLNSGRRSRTFSLAGKIDKLAVADGVVLFDHKTTSSSNDVSDFGSSYWRQLIIDSQATHYELLLRQSGVELDRIVWDVSRKPGIRPRKLNKAEQLEIRSSATYYGFDLTTDAIDHAHQHGDENAELYEYRVAHETITNPDKYFQRRSVPRLREELAEYANELWDIAQDIRQAQRHGRWYRNSGACLNYGTACPFLGICSGHDTADSDNWRRKEQIHAELEVDGDGRDLVTNSRIRCFQTCRRKHYYAYELGLTRADDEQPEALFFGNAWHQALDVYWTAISGGTHDNCHDETDDDSQQQPADYVSSS